jgi:hypothetical protein
MCLYFWSCHSPSRRRQLGDPSENPYSRVGVGDGGRGEEGADGGIRYEELKVDIVFSPFQLHPPGRWGGMLFRGFKKIDRLLRLGVFHWFAVQIVGT